MVWISGEGVAAERAAERIIMLKSCHDCRATRFGDLGLPFVICPSLVCIMVCLQSFW